MFLCPFYSICCRLFKYPKPLQKAGLSFHWKQIYLLSSYIKILATLLHLIYPSFFIVTAILFHLFTLEYTVNSLAQWIVNLLSCRSRWCSWWYEKMTFLIKNPKNAPFFSPDFTLNGQIGLFYSENWIFKRMWQILPPSVLMSQ